MRYLLTLIAALLVLATPAHAARTFAATTDIVSAGSDTAIDLHSAFTVCAWINPSSFTVGGRIIHHGDISTTPFIEWDLRVTTSAHVSLETNLASPVGTTTLSTGTWYAACGIFDGSNATVYVNGTSDGSLAAVGTLTHTTNLTEIGNSSVFTGNAFTGTIAEVGVWNAALTAIPARFANGYAPQLLQPSNLKGYWPLLGQSTEPDLYSAFAGTVTGTSRAAHPRIIK